MTHLIASAGGAVAELVRTTLMRRSLVEVLAFVGLAVLCLALSFGFDEVAKLLGATEDAFRENGPIESAQSVLVGLAAVLFYVAALRFDYEIFYAGVVLALLCALAVLREIPGCGSHFYDGGACLTDMSKDWLTALAIALTLGLVAVRREPLAKRIGDLSFFWILPAGFAGVFLVTGEAMEANYLMGPEETLETAAYLVLLFFAVAINLRPHWFDARDRRALAIDRRRPAKEALRPS